MVRYPVHTKRFQYRGGSAAKRSKVAQQNAVSSRLEQQINELLLQQIEPVQIYTYGQLAHLFGLDAQAVYDCCLAIDGGSNGFTACRFDLSYEEAMAAHGAGTCPPVGRPVDLY